MDWNTQFDRSLIEQGCRFDEDLHALEDYDLLLQVWQHTRSVSSGRVTAARAGCPTGKSDPLTEPAAVDQAVAAAFEKWRTRWQGTQWADIARSWAERLAESERRSRLLQHRLDQTSAEADSQRRLLAERDIELHQMKQQMDQTSAELERSRRLASGTEASLKRLQQENSELAVREASLQQALQALYVSTSWRVTRPLRLFSRLLRGEWR
ncbi:MAG: hypothetical protein MUF20_11105 [Methylotetracoccus sp.]|nr:hypothetical protein [Methylotetracoccus sp.]